MVSCLLVGWEAELMKVLVDRRWGGVESRLCTVEGFGFLTADVDCTSWTAIILGKKRTFVHVAAWSALAPMAHWEWHETEANKYNNKEGVRKVFAILSSIVHE